MEKLALDDTWNILECEKMRDDFRRRIIALKKVRRLAVGDHITLVFENRDTALFQVQEMIRIERLVDDVQIMQEIEVFNSLTPDDGELSATLFIEFQERSNLHPALRQLIGLDKHVALHIGDRFAIPAEFEPGHARPEGISAVQYLRFRFTAEQQAAFRRGREPITLVIDHPHYRAASTLPAETLAELVQDFEQLCRALLALGPAYSLQLGGL